MSGLRVTEQGRALYAGSSLLAELRDFYGRLGRRLTYRELLVEIERLYGDRILKEICLPNNLSAGACLIIATAMLQESAA